MSRKVLKTVTGSHVTPKDLGTSWLASQKGFGHPSLSPCVCVCLSNVSSSGRGVFIDIGYHVYNYLGAGEMAKLLRALAAFLEDLGLISGTHMVAHKL